MIAVVFANNQAIDKSLKPKKSLRTRVTAVQTSRMTNDEMERDYTVGNTAVRRRDEEDGDILSIPLSFSMSYPGYDGDIVGEEGERLTLKVLGTLRTIFCDHYGLEIWSRNGTSLCTDDESDTFQLLMETNSSPNPVKMASTETTILMLGSISVKDSSRGSDLEWMEWQVTYVVTELAPSYWSVKVPGSTQVPLKSQLQNDLQTVLERSIADGTASDVLQELAGSSAFSVNGKEMETKKDVDDLQTKDEDFLAGARVLRLIGIGMVLFTMFLVILMMNINRRRRDNTKKEVSLKGGRCEQSSIPGEPSNETEIPGQTSMDTNGISSIPQDVLLNSDDNVDRMLLMGKETTNVTAPSRYHHPKKGI